MGGVPNYYPDNTIVPTYYPVTASVPTENPITAYVPTDYPVSASIPADYPVTASVPTYYPVSDSKKLSINKVVQPEGITNQNKILTQISISNTNNWIPASLYINKTELDGKKLPVVFFQNNVDELFKNTTYQRITK